MTTGIFTISLDFEIHWGVSDHRTIESYKENLQNVPNVVRRTLKLFGERSIHATWATVGMLFCDTRKELFENVNERDRPTYNNPALSNYNIAVEAGENEQSDPYHFANSVIKQIIATPLQDLGTHTYSHYYCLEPGQSPEQFYHDLVAARRLLNKENVKDAVSIVFPRNQYDPNYLEQCRKTGFTCYRGNYPSWLYAAEAKSTETKKKRLARLIDTYFPLTGQRYVDIDVHDGLMNVPGSCFLRPYNKKLSFLEGLRLRRIKREMTAAAKKKKLYHLWWHPHNFGKDMDKNFAVLEKILDHFNKLATEYGMVSMNMKEIYEKHRNG
ncbi:MAG TPA: polysaccharide deacetylase family protein [Chitinophagaceae bacterium]|jgi:peptidoglycan/xylan/chitin deacetylase (PgdA/CDA1 family)|nr:polysaccharide deacetylase family protein [Chitinophagaceae bacterium]